jgi:hypothetical protein
MYFRTKLCKNKKKYLSNKNYCDYHCINIHYQDEFNRAETTPSLRLKINTLISIL